MARGDLTGTQWARLESVLPKGRKPGRPPIWTRRQLIDGIRFRTRTGVPWRDVPERYGPWARVYDLFRRWLRDGTWQRIFAELQAHRPTPRSSSPGTSTAMPPCAGPISTPPERGKRGLQKESPGGITIEPDDHGLGRSRGGLTTKLHLAVEQGQRPMSIVITTGQHGDSRQFEPVLEKVHVARLGSGRPRTRPDRVRADTAYVSRENRAYLRQARGPLGGHCPRSGHQRVAVTSTVRKGGAGGQWSSGGSGVDGVFGELATGAEPQAAVDRLAVD
ncbi:IS5 family transposase [Streptomyces sp. 6-11-2]|uniref:IS5 family transposase n=1 Tax=Streptomyces sp. 6-11-2 TaxID=2585753 RepID=UPI0035A5EC11